MKVENLIQGSNEWLQYRRTHFNASDCAAMLGISPYQTRSALLHQMHTGIVPDVDAGTQSRFDDGHRFEALARPLAEKIIGQELSPVTISEGNLSASLDGITFDDTVIWEHKTGNASLLESLYNKTIPEQYLPQIEQQLMLSGAERCLFSATKWTGDVLDADAHYWYVSDPVLRERIRTGWAAFHRDLETYTPPEVIPEVIAAPIRDLPAITYKMDGMLLSTNLRSDVKPAILALVEQSKRKLETDQDFADLDALCKKFKQAEEQCALVQSQAVGEIKDVDAFCRDLKELSEIMRQARIAGEKAVASEKDARKLAIVQEAKNAYARHTGALHEEIKPIMLSIPQPDLAGATKGLKKLSAMQEAVDNALRDGQMLADAAAKDIRAKLAWFSAAADVSDSNETSLRFLFSDLQQIISKPMDDFTLTITTRIDKHKADEDAKIERIRAEEQVKARARAEEEARAAAVLEAARIKADQDLMPTVKTMESQIEERRKQAQIAEQSKPFNGMPAKRIRPSDKELIEFVAQNFSVTYGTACDWILEVAENLRVSA